MVYTQTTFFHVVFKYRRFQGGKGGGAAVTHPEVKSGRRVEQLNNILKIDFQNKFFNLFHLFNDEK